MKRASTKTPPRPPAAKEAPPDKLTAKAFLERLKANASEDERLKYERYFPLAERQEADRFIGVRMGTVFELGKAFIDMPPAEIEKLMESDIHEARAGAMSVMAKQYNKKKQTPERQRELYDLYLRRHDRINNWDLVDLAAYYVVGPQLIDGKRDVLKKLAKSKNPWERRTAVLATFAFIREGELDDTYAVATLLLKDKHELVQKAVGWMLRSAGNNRERLKAFLDAHAAMMPRPMLRAAIEKLSPDERVYYLSLREA